MSLPFRLVSPNPAAYSEETLRQVRFARKASQAERRCWAQHPQEAVATALANTVWAMEEYSSDAAVVRALLHLRGQRDVEREGVLWNPLLDGVARGRPLQFSWEVREAARELGLPDSFFKPLSDLLKPIESWLKDADDVESVRPLLAYRSDEILVRIAEHAPLDVRLCQALVDRDATNVSYIVRNERLDAECGRWLARWALDAILSPKGKRILTYGRALGRLDARNLWSPPREALDRLLGAATEAGRIKTTRHRPDRAAHALVELRRHLNHADIQRLIPCVGGAGDYVAPLAVAPAADVACAVLALQNSRSPKLRQTLALNPELRTDPRVRADLIRSSDPIVVSHILSSSVDPTEVRTVLKRLFRTDPRQALTILERQPEHARALEAKDLVPLLRDRQEWIRVRAISLLSLLRSHAMT